MIDNNKSLESLYNSKLKPQLSDLNIKRIAIVSKIKKNVLISILLIVFSLYLSHIFNSVIPIVLTLISMLLFSYFSI